MSSYLSILNLFEDEISSKHLNCLLVFQRNRNKASKLTDSKVEEVTLVLIKFFLTEIFKSTHFNRVIASFSSFLYCFLFLIFITMEMALEKGRALQIVSTSSTVISTNIIEPQIDSFHLIEEHLEEILAKVPTGMKISIVSVVGAFRTGKSFLLNFFLRYLRHGKPDDLSEAWMTKDGMALVEGNMNEGVAIEDDHAAVSFAWRGGQDRQTTGIWMWSEPFVRIAADGESVAVLLMDTQGMFDNDTSMALTAQIFGLSTFVSSYQIYNVDKRLQEDNLQHLALFSEYGRLALRSEEVCYF